MPELHELSKELRALSNRLAEQVERFKKESDTYATDQVKEMAIYADCLRAQAQVLVHLAENIIIQQLPY